MNSRQFEKEYKIKGRQLLAHFNAVIKTKIQKYNFGFLNETYVGSETVIDTIDISSIMVYSKRYDNYVEPSERLYERLSEEFKKDKRVEAEVGGI